MDAEPDKKLEAFFLTFAKRHKINLRLINHETSQGFDFKPINDSGFETVIRQMDVDLHRIGHSQDAVRLSRMNSKSLHEVMEEMSVPHEYDTESHQLRMGIEQAKAHLESAFKRLGARRSPEEAEVGEPQLLSKAATVAAERKRAGASRRGSSTQEI